MSVLTLAAVDMQTCPQDLPSVPAWCAEVVILARHFTQRGLFDAISTHVQLARGRAGTYELIDFVAVLLGYAASGEVAASPCSPHGLGAPRGRFAWSPHARGDDGGAKPTTSLAQRREQVSVVDFELALV